MSSYYTCKIKWTMHDTYNFEYKNDGIIGVIKRINPAGWNGTSFSSFGYWEDVSAGLQKECVGKGQQ